MDQNLVQRAGSKTQIEYIHIECALEAAFLAVPEYLFMIMSSGPSQSITRRFLLLTADLARLLNQIEIHVQVLLSQRMLPSESGILHTAAQPAAPTAAVLRSLHHAGHDPSTQRAQL